MSPRGRQSKPRRPHTGTFSTVHLVRTEETDRVGEAVEFGRGARVPGVFECTAHPDDFSNLFEDFRLLAQCASDIGDWPNERSYASADK